MSTTTPTSSRCGTVAIIGRPNVGKSTLLNTLLGHKLAIVSRNPGTTRDRLLGVLTRSGVQILFLDTPGFGKTVTLLDKRLLQAARATWQEADVLVLVTDARRGLTAGDRRLIEILPAGRPPVILALNKIDTVAKSKLLPQMAEAAALRPFAEIIPVSAAARDGTAELLAALVPRLPAGPFHFPDEQVTDRSTRFLAAELIREQALHVVHDELPHALAVEIDEFRERRRRTTHRVRGHQRRGPSTPITYIRATIYVERPSQRAIVLGQRGACLKAIGMAARQAIEALVGQPVYLDLWVKVWPRWREEPNALKQLGY